MNNTANCEIESRKELFKQIQEDGPAVFLREIGIYDSKIASIDRECNKSDDQSSFICNLFKADDWEVGPVYITIKHGQPTTDQVFEAVYGRGSKCRFRAIMYDGETLDEDLQNPSAYDIIVESFVDGMNSYGGNLFLMKVGFDTDGCIKCDTITAPNKIANRSEAKIPPEDIVRENEFWDVFYWSQYEDFFAAHHCLKAGLDEHWKFGIQGEEEEFYWSVKWDESGIFYEIRSDSHENDCVKEIWESKKFDLQTLFPDYKVTYVSKTGIPARIIINASDLPVRGLLNASLSFKKELAKRILVEFGKFDGFMQIAAEDFKKGKLREVMEFRSLAEAC